MADATTGTLLIYGAYGYTGTLIARQAVKEGLRPILAGRNPVAVRELAAQLGLEHRSFPLDDARRLDAGLEGVHTVLHCAGPFSRTARPMADGCLRAKAHYLDITGEIEVFEDLALQDRHAKEAGVTLLPGVGFDVVPTDSLAAHLKRRLPTAHRLALGLSSSGRISHGTATTMLENAHKGGAVRVGGVIQQVPAGWKEREIDFGKGPTGAVTMPWGDVSTAFHTTGIPNVEVYFALPRAVRLGLKATRHLSWLLARDEVRKLLQKRIDAGARGPTEEQRAKGRSIIWGEVIDPSGRTAVSRLHCPEGYDFTALAALAIARKVLQGEAPTGFQTPAGAFGPDLVLTLPGVRREDLS